jgi:TonB family protein
MRIRLFLLALSAVTATAQPQFQPESLDGPALEAAHQASPDDLAISTRLLRFYEGAANDPDWTKRYALLSAAIQHSPTAGLLGNPAIWRSMPSTFREQVKQLWIAQVQQHPADVQVLRNAANGLDTAPQYIRVGGNVQNSNLLTKVEPVYPPLARQARIQGTVRFDSTIAADGHIQNLQLVSGHPLLVGAATQAVQQWVYKPTLLNGNPVAVVTTLDINFTLQP